MTERKRPSGNMAAAGASFGPLLGAMADSLRRRELKVTNICMLLDVERSSLEPWLHAYNIDWLHFFVAEHGVLPPLPLEARHD